MSFEIPEQICRAADQCPKHYACLQDGDKIYCTVEDAVMGRILFVKCLHDQPCPYKGLLDDHLVCTCPVRREIHRRYGT